MRKDVSNEIVKKGGENINKSETARILQCSRQTIYNREERLKNPIEKRKVAKPSKLDPYKEIIESKVLKFQCKAMSIYLFIKKQGYTGKYGIVKNYVKNYKQEQIKKATIRFETMPGLQAQVDWKEEMKLVNRHGEVFEINIFLIILGYSRYKFIKLTSDRTQKTLFECFVKAFKYFGGVPRELLLDNMKTAVDKARTTIDNAVFNSTFQAFCIDAGTTPFACVGFRPVTKGKAETLARLMERLRVYNEEFDTWEDLDNIVNEFLEELNDETVGGVNIIPSQMYEKEKEYLNTQVNIDNLISYYDQKKEYKIHQDSMINYKGRRYSVPTYLIGKHVTVKEIDSEINIYYNMDQVSHHEIVDKYFNYDKPNLKEIMKSDAYKNKTDEEIEEIISLKQKDKLLEVYIHE